MFQEKVALLLNKTFASGKQDLRDFGDLTGGRI